MKRSLEEKRSILMRSLKFQAKMASMFAIMCELSGDLKGCQKQQKRFFAFDEMVNKLEGDVSYARPGWVAFRLRHIWQKPEFTMDDELKSLVRKALDHWRITKTDERSRKLIKLAEDTLEAV